jgi:high frequency lysogenization protein
VNQLENQTLALAGMFQAAVLIDELAVSGNCDGAAFDGSFDSLFTFDADSTEAVFGQVTCLHSGFTALTDYLGGETRGSSRNIAYYVLSMMKLATRILSDPALSEQLFDGLQEIQRRGGEFELPRSSIISKIDGLYQDTISQLEPRILVRGEQNHLLNNDTAARIRSLLLAGIRSAVLWRQLGGSKWKLFLGRKRYVASAREMLDRD